MNTHQVIFENALSILSLDGKVSCYNYLDAYRASLGVYSYEPDNIASENSRGTHYYIAIGEKTAKGGYYKNRKGNYARSARTKLEDHYSMAIASYKNGNTPNAIKHLGYAVHFLSDAICPPHAAGVSDVNHPIKKPHKKYEDWVNKNVASFAALTAADYYDAWRSGFESINKYAEFSATFKSDIENLKSENYFSITSQTLPLTQKLVAALLYQFYEDTVNANSTASERHEFALQHNKIYFIKNLKSSMYLDVLGMGTFSDTVVHQFSFSGELNQQFRAVYESGSYFRFEPVHCTSPIKTMSFNGVKPIIKNVTNSIEQRFRPTYLGNGYYRIMTGHVADNDFVDVLRAKSDYYNLRDGVDKYNFDPNALNHYWLFEEVVDTAPVKVDAT